MPLQTMNVNTNDSFFSFFSESIKCKYVCLMRSWRGVTHLSVCIRTWRYNLTDSECYSHMYHFKLWCDPILRIGIGPFLLKISGFNIKNRNYSPIQCRNVTCRKDGTSSPQQQQPAARWRGKHVSDWYRYRQILQVAASLSDMKSIEPFLDN